MFLYSAAASAMEPGEELILIGFEPLASIFPSIESIHRRIPYRTRLLTVAHRVLIFLARIGFLGLVKPNNADHSLARKRGLLPISLLDIGFYQDESLIRAEVIFDLRNLEISKQSQITKLIPKTLDDKTKRCFVHVRRGDYLTWPTPDSPAAMPDSWFIEQMIRVEEEIGDTHFLVFSDELEHCRVALGARRNVTFVDCDVNMAWFLMTTCEAGILSPSTLSWWAARVASISSPGLFIAPKYWVNWREKSWNKVNLASSNFLTWV